MARKPRLCKLCGVREAVVPDRNNAAESARGVKSVCRVCHGGRLLGDFRHIMDVEAKRRAAAPESDTP